MKLELTNAWSKIDTQQQAFLLQSSQSTPNWASKEEWKVFENAVLKDTDAIKLAGEKTGVSPRLIMSILAVEQLRLFQSERAIFEQVFAPLKILGVQSQFSWGVMGIKRETAIEIEKRDREALLKFETADIEEERFQRLINPDDRSWSYLYAAVYLKELQDEWKGAGFPLQNNDEDRVGVLATLYNIGFQNSKPKANPQIGGAIIKFNDQDYTFGRLAEEIYYSDQLTQAFPK